MFEGVGVLVCCSRTILFFCFFFSSRRRHTRSDRDWSSDVCSSDLDEVRTEDGEYAPQAGTPYGLFRRFLQSPSKLPCTAPPWGVLVAVDMTEGKIRWQVPLGSMQDFGRKQPPIPPGSVSLGGPIVTAGGLVFIAGTFDPYFRAFDVKTGKELWKAQLPASGHATAMTYRVTPTGKQYVVIAAGGHGKIEGETLGDSLVAFALP